MEHVRNNGNADNHGNGRKTADNNKLKDAIIGISAGLWLLNIADACLLSDGNSLAISLRLNVPLYVAVNADTDTGTNIRLGQGVRY